MNSGSLNPKSISEEPIEAVMWRTMKIMRLFYTDDLLRGIRMTHACTSHRLTRYLNHLKKEGYLILTPNGYQLDPNRPADPPIYRKDYLMNIREQSYMNEEWFQILKDEVEKKSRSQVAREMGYSSTAISLIMSGKYMGKSDKVRDKVLQQYTRVFCPYLKQNIPLCQCVDAQNSKAPTHNPLKMQAWKACQGCLKKCENRKDHHDTTLLAN